MKTKTLGGIPAHPSKSSDNQNVVPRGQRVVGVSPITGGPIVEGPKSSYKPKKTK